MTFQSIFSSVYIYITRRKMCPYTTPNFCGLVLQLSGLRENLDML